MTTDEIANILSDHAAWLQGDEGGKRANLHDADLSGADLHQVTRPPDAPAQLSG